MQATTPVDRLDHAAARQSGDKGKTKSLKREDLKDSWLDPSPRRTARHARLSSRLSLQPKQTGILLTTAPGTGSVRPRLATEEQIAKADRTNAGGVQRHIGCRTRR